jgi:hypothetical protein
LTLKFGEKVLTHKAYVLETNAFEAVLGMDFLSTPRCTGIITFPSPPKLVVDGEFFLLKELANSSAQKVCRIFKTESYTVVPGVKDTIFADLEVQKEKVAIDLFANYMNHQEPLFCTRKNSAFFYDWRKLSKEDGYIWANPPFSQLDKVLVKIALEPCSMLLVTPNWPNCAWMRVLEKLASRQSFIPAETPVYRGDASSKVLPPPPWETIVSLITPESVKINLHELDPKIVKHVQRLSKGWGRDELLAEVRAYPKFDIPPMMEKEVQAEFFDVEMPNVSPIKKVCQILEKTPEFGPKEAISNDQVLVESLPFVDVQFTEVDHKIEDVKMQSLDLSDWVSLDPSAKSHSSTQVNDKDMKEIASLLHQRIFHIEQEMATSKKRRKTFSSTWMVFVKIRKICMGNLRRTLPDLMVNPS